MSDDLKAMMNQQNQATMNVLELQQKMIMLQQRMMTEGATPEIIQQMQELQNAMISSAANSGAAQMDALFGEDGGDDEKQAFIEAHPQPKEMEKYLCIGGFFVTMIDEPACTLEMMDEKSYYVDDMSGSWDIEGREDLLEMLESLLNGRAYHSYNDTFLAIKSGNTKNVSEDDLESYQEAVEGLRDTVEISLKEINECNSILGWDLERAGYLARAGVHTGYITKDEAWEYLKRAASTAKANFADWRAYVVSVVMGRAVHMGYNPGYAYAAEELLIDEPEFFNAHPLKNM